MPRAGPADRRIAPQRTQAALQLAEQLAEQGRQFALLGAVQAGQDGGLVGELGGQDAVDEFASGVGEAEIDDTPVAAVAAALTRPRSVSCLRRLVTAAPEEKVSRASSPGVAVPGAAQRAEQIELRTAEPRPAQGRVLGLLEEGRHNG
ncbi:hypothetical protein SVIOM74S_07576 [Streptomyces violarus]